jgi:hypothetical protein
MTHAIIETNDQIMHHFDMDTGEPTEGGLNVNDIHVSILSLHASLEDAETALPSPAEYTTREARFPMDDKDSGVEDTAVVVFRRITLTIVKLEPGAKLYIDSAEMV